MFPDDALPLGAFASIREEKEEEVIVHFEGTVSCRELKQGTLHYYLKPNRGSSKWFSHGQVIGVEPVVAEENVV